MKTCDLCGIADRDVSTGLAWFRDETGPKPIDRCENHETCRTRVELSDVWPLENADTARRRAARERVS